MVPLFGNVGSLNLSKPKCTEVDGCVEANVIAGKFAQHFKKSYSCNNHDQADHLQQEYSKLRI